MAQPKTCCISGKVYDPQTDKCYDLNHMSPTDPINCPCCPVSYNYDSFTGTCIDIAGNTHEPITCPCCPDGYYYVSIALPPSYPVGFCQAFAGANITSIIPCVNCNCQTVTPRECPTCNGDGHLPIAFTFDPTIKNCVDCDLLNGPRMTNDQHFNNFMSYLLIDPIIVNFKLRK